MLAKVITWGQDRTEALAKMRRALADTAVLGVTTNIPYLLAILEESHFVAGNVNTNYLAEYMSDWQMREEVTDEVWLAMAAVEAVLGKKRGGRETAVAGQTSHQPDPWNEVTGWRNVNDK
jgi:acetyl/propionyl-CoA carboxylase alpha subunit